MSFDLNLNFELDLHIIFECVRLINAFSFKNGVVPSCIYLCSYLLVNWR